MPDMQKGTGGIMFTGIVEEKGKVRYIQLTGESGMLAQHCREWCVSDSYVDPAGRIYCRCDGRDDQKE